MKMTGRIVDFEVIEVDIDTVEFRSRSSNIESVINSKWPVFKVSFALGKRGLVINSSIIKTPLDFLELFWTPEVMDTFVIIIPMHMRLVPPNLNLLEARKC
jgi:hypothetical protein